MKIKTILLLLLPLVAFASGGGEGDKNYDIIERTFNFLLFAGILLYLLKNKAVVAYKSRIKSIADKLEDIQTTLKASNEKKEVALQKAQKAKEDAKELLITSKKEANILVEKLESDMNHEIDILEKSHKERMEIERRHMKREVVSEVMDELFDESTLTLDKKEFTNIILKKVA